MGGVAGARGAGRGRARRRRRPPQPGHRRRQPRRAGHRRPAADRAPGLARRIGDDQLLRQLLGSAAEMHMWTRATTSWPRTSTATPWSIATTIGDLSARPLLLAELGWVALLRGDVAVAASARRRVGRVRRGVRQPPRARPRAPAAGRDAVRRDGPTTAGRPRPGAGRGAGVRRAGRDRRGALLAGVGRLRAAPPGRRPRSWPTGPSALSGAPAPDAAGVLRSGCGSGGAPAG